VVDPEVFGKVVVLYFVQLEVDQDKVVVPLEVDQDKVVVPLVVHYFEETLVELVVSALDLVQTLVCVAVLVLGDSLVEYLLFSSKLNLVVYIVLAF